MLGPIMAYWYHLSEKRHRLSEAEVPEVMRGLILRLARLVAEGRDEDEAEVVFKCILRLNGGKLGRPRYPVFTWELAADLVERAQRNLDKNW